jgi:hypothetical protein
MHDNDAIRAATLGIDRLGRRQRTYECNAQHARTVAGSPYERAHRKKQRPSRLGN